MKRDGRGGVNQKKTNLAFSFCFAWHDLTMSSPTFHPRELRVMAKFRWKESCNPIKRSLPSTAHVLNSPLK